jgi:hypothetical protein
MRIVHLAKLLFFLCLLSPLGAFAQPNGINYQLVARNNSGEIVISKTIKVKASILKGSLKGAPVLMELHTVRTNEVGLFNIIVGQGSGIEGNIKEIQWGEDNYFLKVEVDPTGGYTFNEVGVFQFLNVPYAFFATEARKVSFNKNLDEMNLTGFQTQFNAGFSDTKRFYRGMSTTITGKKANGHNVAIYGEFVADGSPVNAIASEGYGLYGLANGAQYNCGVYGETMGNGTFNYGTYGLAGGTTSNPNFGLYGQAEQSSTSNYAVYGVARNGLTNYAGYFDGNVRILSALTVGSSNANGGAGALTLGTQSNASANYSFAGGERSGAEGIASFAFGTNTIAQANNAFSIGQQTKASGINAFAGGNYSESTMKNALAFGEKCYSYGINGIALGSNVMVKDYAFGFSDNSSTLLMEAKPNTFSVRATGGVMFYTNANLTSGVQLNPGDGAWSIVSDKNKKEHFKSVNNELILNKIARLDIKEWNYKSQHPSTRHIGVMAQDFKSAFQLGEAGNDTTIHTGDMDGILLAGIQALNQRINALEVRTRQLEEENAQLRKQASASNRFSLFSIFRSHKQANLVNASLE